MTGAPADGSRGRGWRRAAAGLAVAFLALNAGLLVRTGVQIGGDTIRYTSGADALRSGQMVGGFEWSYRGYMAVVALMQVLGAGLPGVVGLQLGVAALAGVALASLGTVLGGPLAGLVGAAFLLANPDVAQWHAYILTDSLYGSGVVLVVWAVWRAAMRRGLWYGFALLLLLPITTLRPTGLVLLPVTAAFWIARGVVARDRLGVALGVVLIAGVILVVASPRVHDTVGAVPGYALRSGRVIYRHSAFQVEMPPDATSGGAGWLADLAYVGRHPVATFALGARRVAVEVAHVRPYYSGRHNALIVAILLPLYGLAALGAAATWRHPLTQLLLGVIAGHLGLVAIALADYDGRFLVHIVGPLGALAAAGVGRLGRGARSTRGRDATLVAARSS